MANKNKKTTLIDSMKQYYTDKSGKTVMEAVDLGMLFLRYFDALGELKKHIIERHSVEAAGGIDYFFLNLVIDASSIEAYEQQETLIRAQIEGLKEVDVDIALRVQDIVFNMFLPILQNAAYSDEVWNIPLRFAWFEAMSRYLTAQLVDVKEIAYANFMATSRPLSLLAYLASNGDIQKYQKMSLDVEYFMHNAAKRML